MILNQKQKKMCVLSIGSNRLYITFQTVLDLEVNLENYEILFITHKSPNCAPSNIFSPSTMRSCFVFSSDATDISLEKFIISSFL